MKKNSFLTITILEDITEKPTFCMSCRVDEAVLTAIIPPPFSILLQNKKQECRKEGREVFEGLTFVLIFHCSIQVIT